MSDFPKEHNQFTDSDDAAVGGIAADRLRSIIERVERMDEEKKAIASDQKDIMLEAKAAGYDCKVIRQIIQMRKKDPAELDGQELILETYKRARGM